MTDRPEINEVEALASMKSIAKLCRAFYKDLRAEGFNAAEALHMTNTWLRTMLTSSPGEDA